MELGKWVKVNMGNMLAPEFLSTGGCYVIYLEGQLSYIGQSQNVRKRMRAYKVNYSIGGCLKSVWGYHKKMVVKIKYHKKFGEWAMTEARLIKRLKPPLNCIGSIGKRRGT